MLGFVRWKALAHFLQNSREMLAMQKMTNKEDPVMMDSVTNVLKYFVSYQGLRQNDSPANQICSSQF